VSGSRRFNSSVSRIRFSVPAIGAKANIVKVLTLLLVPSGSTLFGAPGTGDRQGATVMDSLIIV
jgi:hypothetical protein